MEKKKAKDQKNWSDMYVYEADVVADLMEMVSEFVGECEHSGAIANCGEISSDTIDNMPEWHERRKKLLWHDFIQYYLNGIDWTDIVEFETDVI